MSDDRVSTDELADSIARKIQATQVVINVTREPSEMTVALDGLRDALWLTMPGRWIVRFVDWLGERIG